MFLLGQLPVQGKQVLDLSNQPLFNGTEVIRSLRQQQPEQNAPLERPRRLYLPPNCFQGLKK